MTTSLAKVIGSNARKLRLAAGVTLDEFALVARQYGLPWTSGRVGDLESGRVVPNLETILAVATALGHATSRPVTLTDLLATDDPVRVNDQLTIDAVALRATEPVTGVCESASRFDVATGRGPRLAVIGSAEWKAIPAPLRRNLDPVVFVETRSSFREADMRLCKALDIDRDFGAAVMAKLWEHTFSAERDERAGSDANAQRRGQVSRQLKAELKEAIS